MDIQETDPFSRLVKVFLNTFYFQAKRNLPETVTAENVTSNVSFINSSKPNILHHSVRYLPYVAFFRAPVPVI